MLGCYIICCEILVEVNQWMVKVEVDRQHVEVEVDRHQVKGRGSRPVNSKSKISTTSQPKRGRSESVR